jgi:phage shock protein A
LARLLQSERRNTIAEEGAMGIFSRFTDIINSNLNSILDKAEDPEKIIRLMIQEMEDTLVEVRSTAARAIADKKEITRKLDALENEADDWAKKAELALDKGREDLAKAALAEKTATLKSAEALRAQQTALTEGLVKLNEDISSLEAKLADAKVRQQAIVARHQTATKRLEVRKRLHDYRIDDAMVRFESFERRMDHLEGQVESYDLGTKRGGLAQEITDLESQDAIEKELEELKARRAGKSAKAADQG